MNHAGILILEDEAVIALSLETALRDRGFVNLVVCDTIKGATTEIKKHVPTAAIIDLMAEGSTSSVDVAQRLNQQLCHILFIADFKEDARDLPDALRGCPVIEKPFRDEEVIEKLDRIVTVWGAA